MSLHHVGFAVPKIEPAVELYVRRFGYEVCSPIVHDAVQTAHVQFLRLPGDSSYLEFVAPDSPESKLTEVAKNGGSLNHFCYRTHDIEQAVEDLRKTQMLVLCEPTPAPAFNGRRIAWLLGRDRVPIELVESGAAGEL